MEINTSIHSNSDQSPSLLFPKELIDNTCKNENDFNYYKSIFLSNIFADENSNPNKEGNGI